MFRSVPFFAFLGLLLLSCSPDSGGKDATENQEKAGSQATAEEKLNDQEPEYAFLADAYRYNAQLIRLNEFAATKAGTLALKDFARQSAQYHKVLQKETQQIADKYSIILSSVPEENPEDKQPEDKHIKELTEKEGTPFDIAYLKAIEDLENNMLKSYEKGSASAPDQEIRNRAVKTISNLKAHQLTIKELLEEIKEK